MINDKYIAHFKQISRSPPFFKSLYPVVGISPQWKLGLCYKLIIEY